jgi:peptide/nickel transport system ATP-binding protein
MTVALSTLQDATQVAATRPVIEVEDLVVEYATRSGTTRAVDGVSLAIAPGEILGLAGESGCGKSTLGNAIMQVLRPPARIASGRVLFRGEDLVGRSAEELRRHRWRNVSMVFQSAMNALNPVMRVGDQFVDMIRAHERVSRRDALRRAGERPELVIMDEPTTALDVVVQREILQQVRDLQAELGFAVLFVTHDLSLLLELAHRVAIMYAGEIVELAPAATLRDAPRHPYTVGLLSSFPPLTGPVSRLTGIPGSPPDLAAPPSGCRFHARCPHCIPGDTALFRRQVEERPLLRDVGPGHRVACHLVEEAS